MSTYILGIDPSKKNSGFCFINAERKEIVWSYSSKIETMHDIRNAILTFRANDTKHVLVSDNIQIAMEAGFQGRGKEIVTLERLRGMLTYAFVDFLGGELSMVTYYSPTTVKKTAGNGQFTKEQMRKKFDEAPFSGKDKVVSEDEVDAFWIAVTHAHSIGVL